jgi:hypothetical protein
MEASVKLARVLEIAGMVALVRKMGKPSDD